MSARHFDEIMKSHIPAENAPMIKCVLNGRYMSLWHARDVIDHFGSKESSKRSKYMNRGWISWWDRWYG